MAIPASISYCQLGMKYDPQGDLYQSTVLPLWKKYQRASFIGTTEDLYTLLSKGVSKYDPPPTLPIWDFSKPTLYGKLVSHEYHQNVNLITFSQFDQALKSSNEWFAEVRKYVKRIPGLIMAGGYVVKIYLELMGYRYNTSNLCQDVDLFLTGPAATSPEKAKQIVLGLERIFIKFRRSHGHYSKSSMARTSNCINFFEENKDYSDGGDIAQVILRLYTHPSEVLHSFDLGSCQLAYDGEEIFTTSAGLISLKMGINIVDMKRRRKTYEKRLAKYHRRGFGIVFPNLSLSVLTNDRIINKYFIIEKGIFSPLINGNQIDGEEYSGMLESYRIQIDDCLVQKHNIANYIRWKCYQVKPYYLIRLDLHPRDRNPSICDELRQISFQIVINHYYNQLIENIHRGELNKLKIGEMKNYLTPEIIGLIVLIRRSTDNRYEQEEIIKAKLILLKEEIKKELNGKTVPLEWKSAGEGNDLNASFGMERVPIQDWYGEGNYLPDNWDISKVKHYLPGTKERIELLMLIRNRPESSFNRLPMELMFRIFDLLVSY